MFVDEALRSLIAPLASSVARRYATHPESAPIWIRRALVMCRARVLTTVPLAVTGQRITVDPFDCIGTEIVRHGVFEADTVAVLSSLLAPGAHLLDIGANIGQYTLIGSHLVGPEGSVTACEPNPRTLQILKQNVAQNLCRNVTIIEQALSDRQGTAEFHLGHSDNSGGSSLGRTINTSSRTLTVETNTLDRLRASLAPIDVIKIDVEGAELLAFRGAEATLARDRPTIVCELTDKRFTKPFGYETSDLVDWLQTRNYSVWAFALGRPVTPYQQSLNTSAWLNVVAIPSDKVELIVPALSRRLESSPSAQDSRS